MSQVSHAIITPQFFLNSIERGRGIHVRAKRVERLTPDIVSGSVLHDFHWITERVCSANRRSIRAFRAPFRVSKLFIVLDATTSYAGCGSRPIVAEAHCPPAVRC
jgi:hypothetical protein